MTSLHHGARRILVELGDFYADETRRHVLGFEVPARASLGAAQIVKLVFRYVELPVLIEHLVTLPLSVNAVHGDEAAGRVQMPEVERERLLLSVQRAKRDGEEALRRGDRKAVDDYLAGGVARLAAAPMPDASVVEEPNCSTSRSATSMSAMTTTTASACRPRARR